MTKQEFESGIGYEVTDEQYEAAEKLWRATTSFNKADFYEDWKKHHGSSILANIAEMNEVHKYLQDKYQQQRDEIAKLLLKVSCATITGDEAREKMLGMFRIYGRDYAKVLVESRVGLTEKEAEFVLSTIS